MKYTEIYNIISTQTPLQKDCGTLCSNACCKADKDTGMLLFPREEIHYEKNPQSWFSLHNSSYKLSSGYILKLLICNGTCPRENRPLSCRIFPLIPYIAEDGFLEIRPDLRAVSTCPLLKGTNESITEDFIDALYDAFEIMIDNDEIIEFIEIISNQQDEISHLTNL